MRKDHLKTTRSTCLFVVLQLRHVSAAGLRNSLPGHQVSHYHGRRADLCSVTDTSAAVRRRHTRVDVRTLGAFGPVHCGWRDSLTWLLLSGLGQVGDARVGAHEDVAGVQGALQEALLGLRYVDAAQRSFGQRVGRHQSQTVHAYLVDAVYGLKQFKTNLAINNFGNCLQSSEFICHSTKKEKYTTSQTIWTHPMNLSSFLSLS